MSETVRRLPLNPEIQIDYETSLHLIEPEHSERLFEIFEADPEIRRSITWAAGLDSVEAVRQAIELSRQKGESRYVLLAKGGIVAYAAVSPSRYPERDAEYDIGYLCAPEERGKGYVTKGVSKLISELSGSADTIAAYIHDGNAASQALAYRLGFERTEELVEDRILNCTERRYAKVV